MVYKKKKYSNPEMDIIKFLNEDIITLSLYDGNVGEDGDNEETYGN